MDGDNYLAVESAVPTAVIIYITCQVFKILTLTTDSTFRAGRIIKYGEDEMGGLSNTNFGD
jgi:hypothetical protein